MDNKALQKYYGTNYYKAMANMAKANNQSRAAFLNTYPHSTINKFKFTTVMNKDGSVKFSNIWFVNEKDDLTDITTKAFLTNMSMTKYLTNYTQNYEGSFPIIWLASGTIQLIPKGYGHFYTRFGRKSGYYDGFPAHDILNYSINNFKVYINNKDYFMSKFPELSIDFPGKPFIWDDTGSYFTTLFAVYLATYCCGVSSQHLKPNDDTYPMITSIMRFHVYFTVRRLLRRWEGDESMYAASGEFSGSKLYRQILKLPWTDSYESFNNNGVKGVHNITVVKSGWKTHYKRYVPSKSDGLTKIGLQYINQSIEAYVYAILGAQAKTRVSIVNHGGGSLETQQEFRTLVKDAIVNYSISTWILNMNTAISDTHVTQDLAISPETWLVPSKMIILKKPIMGYNNLLKTASSAMHFGVNSKVNYSGGVYRPVLSAVHTDHDTQQPFNEHASHSKTTQLLPAPSKTNDALHKLELTTPSKIINKLHSTGGTITEPPHRSNSTIIVIGLLAGFVISKYVV